jgi:L-amino acid N-acyltransferase YncA
MKPATRRKTMDAVSIRPASEADLEQVAAIYADAVIGGTASYELDPPDLDEMRRRHRSLTEGGFPYFVAEGAGVIAGYAYAGPFRPRPAYRFVVEDSVYVAPQAKGRGIGRALMQHLIAETQSLGFRQMIAVIGDGRPDSASVRLHEALGFRHSGRLEGSGYKHGRWLDTVFMQLSLNGGTATGPDAASLPEQRFRRT